MGVEYYLWDGNFGLPLAHISQSLMAFNLVLIMSHMYSLRGSRIRQRCKTPLYSEIVSW